MACSLRIPRLPGVRQLDLQALRSRLLAEGEHGSLQSQSWEEFRVDDVEVKFSIGYAYTTVYLLFEVHEPEIRATLVGIIWIRSTVTAAWNSSSRMHKEGT